MHRCRYLQPTTGDFQRVFVQLLGCIAGCTIQLSSWQVAGTHPEREVFTVVSTSPSRPAMQWK
jgi:hypothetical protein